MLTAQQTQSRCFRSEENQFLMSGIEPILLEHLAHSLVRITTTLTRFTAPKIFILSLRNINILTLLLLLLNYQKITEWTPYKTRPAGRPKLRWMDQVEEDLKRMKIIGWRAKVEDRQEWNRIVEQTKTHPGL